MYLKRFQKSNKIPPTIPCKTSLDLDNARKIQKSRN